MERKITTIAIQKKDQASILCKYLDSNGIEASLYSIRDESPLQDSSYYRILISEKDLSKALRILEKYEQSSFEQAGNDKYVLIPIDFSKGSEKICRLGIQFAARRSLSVVLFNVYSSSFLLPQAIIGDSISIQTTASAAMKLELNEASLEINKLKIKLEEAMCNGSLPTVPIRTILRYGIPEDAILSYAKRHKPVILIMGTRGRGGKNSDLIGSVAAEIIDSAQVPTLVIPEEIPLDDFIKTKHVALATNFEERDLMLFQAYSTLITSSFNPQYHVFNTSHFSQEWNTIQLKAIENYFSNTYPNLNIDYSMLESGNFEDALEKFLPKKSIDLIVVSTYRRNFFSKLIKPSMARKLLCYAHTPLLVMNI